VTAARVQWLPAPHRRVDGSLEVLRAPRLAFDELAYGPLQGVLASPRVGPAVFGLGLLEAVPESALVELARRPQDDGVRGRLNRVWDPVTQRMAVGRFGWEANTSSLAAQVQHDGRARYLREAVLWHGGEAQASRRRFEALDEADQAALLTFLASL
jgi:CxxC motif-containing protein (DUF1111 family)